MAAKSPQFDPARAATETLERFLIGTVATGGAVSEPQGNAGSRISMVVDPRAGTRLTLHQRQRGPSGEVGDYAVPGARYGVRSGELLRLDCGTGRVIGIIPSRG